MYKNLEMIPKLELVSIDKGFIQPDGEYLTINILFHLAESENKFEMKIISPNFHVVIEIFDQKLQRQQLQ